MGIRISCAVRRGVIAAGSVDLEGSQKEARDTLARFCSVFWRNSGVIYVRTHSIRGAVETATVVVIVRRDIDVVELGLDKSNSLFVRLYERERKHSLTLQMIVK